MASTPTTRTRAMKQDTGDNENTWGVEQNAGTIDQFDRAWGVAAVTVNTTATLSTTDYVDNQASKIVLILSGTGGTLTAPAVDKPYLVINGCSGDVTMTPDGGTGVLIRAGSNVWYYTNAAGDTGFVVDPTLDEIKAAAASLSLNSQKIVDLATGTDAADAVNKAQMDAAIANAAAINLPNVTGNSGEFLTNDGTTPGWAKLLAGAGISKSGADGADTTFALDVASQAQAQAGTDNTKGMTPLRTAEAIATLSVPGMKPLGAFIDVSGVAAVDVDLPPGYEEYVLKFWLDGDTNNQKVQFRTSTNGGSSFDSASGNYSYSGIDWNDSASGATGFFSASATEIVSSSGGLYGYGNGSLTIYQPAEASLTKVSGEIVYDATSGILRRSLFVGQRDSASDVDAVRLLVDAGTFSIKCQLYGVATA